MNGTIVRLVRDRGFGFIKDQQGNEIFFHASGLPAGGYDSLSEGQEVVFDKEQDTRGRGTRAVNVRLA